MPEVVAVPDAPDVGDAVRPAGIAVCSVLPACEAQPVTKTASTRQQILRKGLSPKLLLPWRVFSAGGSVPVPGASALLIHECAVFRQRDLFNFTRRGEQRAPV